MTTKARKLHKKSNFDKRDRWSVDGVGPIIIVEAGWCNLLDGYDNATAERIAKDIASRLSAQPSVKLEGETAK